MLEIKQGRIKTWSLPTKKLQIILSVTTATIKDRGNMGHVTLNPNLGWNSEKPTLSK